jgi:gas vesicle protein
MAELKKRPGGIALLGGLIAGAAGGAAAGLLLAPKAGRVTRRFVSQKSHRAYRNVRGKLSRD